MPAPQPQPSAAEFKELFPQFAATDDTDIERWLGQAPLRFTPRLIGTQWHMLAYTYTAHQLVSFPPAAAANNAGDHLQRGPITSERLLDGAASGGRTSPAF